MTTAAPPPRSRFVTRKRHEADILMLVDAIGKALAEYVAAKTEPLLKRIAELEARPAFDYTDTFEQGRSYRKGQGCTQGGSIFVAMKDYPAAPGTPDSGWQLAVKRGRDAR